MSKISWHYPVTWGGGADLVRKLINLYASSWHFEKYQWVTIFYLRELNFLGVFRKYVLHICVKITKTRTTGATVLKIQLCGSVTIRVKTFTWVAVGGFCPYLISLWPAGTLRVQRMTYRMCHHHLLSDHIVFTSFVFFIYPPQFLFRRRERKTLAISWKKQ